MAAKATNDWFSPRAKWVKVLTIKSGLKPKTGILGLITGSGQGMVVA
jgi:hypothetical protein